MIGIFGGTFDPIHNGHVRIALDALEELGLAQVRLIPLGQAVHRDQPKASAQQRLQMVAAAIDVIPGLVCDDREIRRQGSSYMVDTLQSLCDEQPSESLCLLLGSDAFNGFLSWYQPERILQLANIAVLQRPGYQLPEDVALRTLVQQHECADVDSFGKQANGAILFHNVTQLDISSSNIRQRIASARNPAALLPEAVIRLIQQQNLYC